ncbi:GPI-GlcNAc transferase complex, PIG-H component-domain-containing protein [Annulohypoxylon moriforme]|nr:GPI-GlcNAc transferase complex, PIG-H component-domain-containing protein [Annulohypoxylon moriforme]
MLTIAPHMIFRRPSPTTVEFVVSTLPLPTLRLRITLAAIYLLRLILSLGVFLLLYSVWAQSPYSTSSTPIEQLSSPAPLRRSPLDISISSNAATIANGDDGNDSTILAIIEHNLQALLGSRIGLLCSTLAASLPPWVIVPCSLVTLYLLSLRIGTEERLLVLRGLGIQTSSSGDTIFSPLKTRFIPTDKIQDILINEAFRGFVVRHILVVIVEGEENVVVVFPKLLPRPRILEKVWRGVRRCLYEPERHTMSRQF